MEQALVYDKTKKERELLIRQIRDMTARLSDAQLTVWECAKAEAVREHLEQESAPDLAVMEISSSSDVDLTRMLRGSKELLELMLVADASISPMEYLTPEIRACSLLLRPCTTQQLKQVVRSFMSAYFQGRQTGGGEPSIRIESRQGTISVPFRSIYYIEVQGKKLFIRQQDREYTKYDSLENVQKILPDYFMQSHRSFVFNTRFLERVRLSENTIYLEHGVMVPLSRTYKEPLKEFIDGKK